MLGTALDSCDGVPGCLTETFFVLVARGLLCCAQLLYQNVYHIVGALPFGIMIALFALDPLMGFMIALYTWAVFFIAPSYFKLGMQAGPSLLLPGARALTELLQTRPTRARSTSCSAAAAPSGPSTSA